MSKLKAFHSDSIRICLAVLLIHASTVAKPSLPKTTDFVITKPYTITLPTFENPKKVAKENWESMFWENYGEDHPQSQAEEPMQIVSNPNYYVVNQPLADPSSFTSGYYPKRILV
jgi:hypothetical protein